MCGPWRRHFKKTSTTLPTKEWTCWSTSAWICTTRERARCYSIPLTNSLPKTPRTAKACSLRKILTRTLFRISRSRVLTCPSAATSPTTRQFRTNTSSKTNLHLVHSTSRWSSSQPKPNRNFCLFLSRKATRKRHLIQSDRKFWRKPKPALKLRNLQSLQANIPSKISSCP